MTDDEKIVIDVMTGASAGAMTAAIVAQKMLYSANEFRDPYDNPLYNVWVKRIDLDGLLETVDEATGEVEPPLRSIFSSNMVEGIAEDTLLGRYATGEWPAPITHMAAARSISIGMTLTNLNGVDYGYDMQPCGKFIYTRHEDQMTRVVSVDGTDKPEVWRELADASVASGAYPLAFRAKELDRRRADYTKNGLEPWTDDPSRFTYTDGGILQNEPLGMAKNLVDDDRQALVQRQPVLFVCVAAWENFERGLELLRGECGLLPDDEAVGEGAAWSVGVSGLDYSGGDE